MKKRSLILLTIVQITGHYFFSKEPVSASNCPFDSYMIINGKCHDMTQEQKNVSSETPQNDYSNPNLQYEYRESIVPIVKQCNDFEYQESAQRYFKIHPEHQYLDIDSDGYACDNLPRIKNNLLTSAIWNNLIYENRQKKLSTNNERSLNYQEVVGIIGFYPNASKGNKIIWEDPINSKVIKIRFHNNEIADMKGSGFRRQ